jgi:hypothetical protein
MPVEFLQQRQLHVRRSRHESLTMTNRRQTQTQTGMVPPQLGSRISAATGGMDATRCQSFCATLAQMPTKDLLQVRSVEIVASEDCCVLKQTADRRALKN